jgi:hypothetical protein
MIETTSPAAGAADAAKPAEPVIDALSLFQSDVSAEERGVPIQFGRTTIFVKALSDPAIQTIYEQQRRRQSKIRQANGGMLPPPMVEANDIEVVTALVTGWDGMPDPDNRTALLPYSPDAAKKLLARRDLRNLRIAIFAEASTHENFRLANLDRVEGNSARSSAPA